MWSSCALTEIQSSPCQDVSHRNANQVDAEREEPEIEEGGNAYDTAFREGDAKRATTAIPAAARQQAQ